MITLERIDEKLDLVINATVELKTVLLGTNSDKGLVGQVAETTKRIDTLKTAIALIIGSGTLGGGIAALVNLLS